MDVEERINELIFKDNRYLSVRIENGRIVSEFRTRVVWININHIGCGCILMRIHLYGAYSESFRRTVITLSSMIPVLPFPVA